METVSFKYGKRAVELPVPEKFCLKIGTEKMSLGEAESVIASHSGKAGFVQNGSLLAANRW